jgi:hypothetical protein
MEHATMEVMPSQWWFSSFGPIAHLMSIIYITYIAFTWQYLRKQLLGHVHITYTSAKDVSNWCPEELRVTGGKGCQNACQIFKSR